MNLYSLLSWKGKIFFSWHPWGLKQKEIASGRKEGRQIAPGELSPLSEWYFPLSLLKCLVASRLVTKASRTTAAVCVCPELMLWLPVWLRQPNYWETHSVLFKFASSSVTPSLCPKCKLMTLKFSQSLL